MSVRRDDVGSRGNDDDAREPRDVESEYCENTYMLPLIFIMHYSLAGREDQTKINRQGGVLQISGASPIETRLAVARAG